MRTVLRWLLLLGFAMLLLLLVPTGLLWVWSSSDGSLASALAQAPRWLPVGHSLETRDVQGNLAHGGRVGWLRWQHGGLSVEATGVQWRWSPAQLLDGKLMLDTLTLDALRVEDQRPSEPESSTAAPSDFNLPLKVQASVQVGALRWVSSAPQDLGPLGFNYLFDSYQHSINKGYIHILSNKYEFSGQLQAQGDLALALRVAGTVQQAVPGSSQTLSVLAHADLKGKLAGSDAQLALQASLKPASDPPKTHRDAGAPLQAQLSAQLAPWQAQKVIQAQGQWQGLNLSELWPQLPQTRLDGTLAVQPEGASWQASLQLRNALPGTLNQQRVPLEIINTTFNYHQGAWRLQTLRALGAGGELTGQGQVGARDGGSGLGRWQAQVQVKAMNPALIDSRLPVDAIGGNLSAQQDAKGIAFAAQLLGHTSALGKAADPAKPGTSGLKLVAQGVWAAPHLQLNQLQFSTDQARLQAQLDYDSAKQSAHGQITLDAPGLQGAVAGTLGRIEGAGNVTLDLSDAARATRWLARWPGATALLGPTLAATQWHGQAQLNAQWQGGWQNQGHDLALTAQLRSSEFDWAPRTGVAAATAARALPAGRSRALQVNATGSLDQLQVNGSGDIGFGAQQIGWRTRVQAGRTPAQAWRAQVEQLDLDLRIDQPQQRWQLSLGTVDDRAAAGKATVVLDWVPSTQGQTLSVSAGLARIKGPLGGTSHVQWQPLRWSQGRPADDRAQSPAPQWQTQGQIDRLPLAWVDLLGGKTLTDLGLGSDLTFSGQWDAAQGNTLHASLLLERSAGDVHLLAGTVGEQAVAAGMRETRLQVNLDGDRLSANLRWDSQRAGRALMAFSTQLQQQDQTWTLPGSAPVGGSLQLDLPPMAAWSALAPPGWRLRGTMGANVNLEGTIDQPLWSGTLQAKDLALRSLVDGIDFSQGQFEARLHDQQLDITRFTLRGAGAANAPNASGTAGGTLDVTGTAQLRPASAGPGQGLHLKLQAQAQALRLSARPDRRITVSGKLTADLLDAELTLRGALMADQALFTLPEDSTPQLGSDVVVRRPASSSQPEPSAKPAKPKARPLNVDLQVDLDPGSDFQVRGMGVETRLAGKLKLSAKDITQPSLNGTLRTVSGTYRAYGQRLDIERGLIRFYGPPDNPALTVLAIRPKLTQRVGVQISGSALAPIIALYADPDLPEAEKLGWLLLGRSPTGGGAETAVLQQAALALLGKTGQGMTDGLSQALGLDEISFGSGGGTSTTDASSTDSSGASITLGKRLSKDFYVAYESSFNGAMGVLRIFYDLSKNLTLRAQTGEQSAMDLIYTRRYD